MITLRPNRLFAAVLLLAVSFPGHASAQIPTLDTSKPIAVQGPAGAQKKVKNEKFLGQVLSVTPQMIQVRSRENSMQVRTFRYTPELRAKMAQVRAKRDYRYGDAVEIVYAAGSDVASRVKGKPSKAG